MAGAVNNCPFIEYCYDPPRWDYTIRDLMLTEPLKVEQDGYIRVPDKPGLGVELNHELLDRYTILRNNVSSPNRGPDASGLCFPRQDFQEVLPQKVLTKSSFQDIIIYTVRTISSAGRASA